MSSDEPITEVELQEIAMRVAAASKGRGNRSSKGAITSAATTSFASEASMTMNPICMSRAIETLPATKTSTSSPVPAKTSRV